MTQAMGSTTAGPAGRNWAGNLAYGATRLAHPGSIDELRAELATGATGARCRVLGSRHSFNDLADTTGTLIAVDRLPVEVDTSSVPGAVRVSGGIRYGDLAPVLTERGLALGNLASLPHISVAGAVATGTHGSGDRSGSLASAVRSIEIITASGELRRFSRGDEEFAGAVVNLGALGVVVALELDVEPTYRVAQTVYEGVRWQDALAGFDALTSAGDSVSLFTTWRDADRLDQVWVKSREGRAAADLSAFGGVPADGPRHPLPGIDPEPCTEQLGVLGPWYDRLPHFRLEFTPSAGDELQSEYLVPRQHAVDAIDVVRAMAEHVAPLLQVSEVRTVAADDLWLSSSYGADAVGLHFTWRPDEAAVLAFLPRLEAGLEPFSARPHWGKLFTTPADRMPLLYPRWADFAGLRTRLDPDGVFRNAFLARIGL